ncbi:unnamed protein product [Vitrella brassicaformis CCMP3155]|uniref:BTB domain-containing protein n=2 Tax=Vitrella brassicaformis TaxID=1169539 RepID=A0A0G4EHN2_VITBC|nr:unnamed protein product [Vitrella brassicaformis CCMP3155]|mmetsp:Transcript_2933/g.6675  ORF Transcript_2933/g.6675 Transcript_2933/m.6675 type:complete len:232 (+) Transcript_2933:119-814(+)|eukprot:CEL95409.1 unnamed protein product [Vitrella brassicaformis CCMP3155]
MTTEVVKLNVGGKTFEVAKSTLMKHPDAMLAKLVDEKWTPNQSEALFVDADGDLFAYVLQYYRRGTPVSVPHHDGVTKDQLKKEFDYFGIPLSDDMIAVELAPSFADLNRARDRCLVQALEGLDNQAAALSSERTTYMSLRIARQVLSRLIDKTEAYWRQPSAHAQHGQTEVRLQPEFADANKALQAELRGYSKERMLEVAGNVKTILEDLGFTVVVCETGHNLGNLTLTY